MRSRTLVLAITTALLVGAGPAQAHGGHHHKRHKPRAVDVQLLSINDFHGNLAPPGTITLPGGVRTPAGGAEYLATHINALRAQNRNTLVVSAGDNIGASPLVSGLFHDEPTIEAFNAMGVDISSVGNHEFDEGSAELLRMQDGGCHPVDGCQDGDGFAGADFDYLAANVVDDDTGRTLFRPYEIRRVGGVKVGFIGVVLKDTPTIVTPSGVEGLDVRRRGRRDQQVHGQAQEEGRARDRRAHAPGRHRRPRAGQRLHRTRSGPLADIIGRSSKEVDLYLTGHTHQAYNCVIGGKRATSASSFGRVLTDANLRIDRRTGQVVSVSADNQIVTQDVAKDPAQTAILNKYTTISAPIANRRIGASTAPLTPRAERGRRVGARRHHRRLPARGHAPSGFGDAVVAFMNPGGIRTRHRRGRHHLRRGVRGAAVRQQPGDHDAHRRPDRPGARAAVGRPGHEPRRCCRCPTGSPTPGARAAPLGSRVDDASIKINGTTVDPAASYRVTVNSFLADGGDGFTELRNGTNRLGGAVDLDALAAYLSLPANDPIAPTPRDRITVVP